MTGGCFSINLLFNYLFKYLSKAIIFIPREYHQRKRPPLKKPIPQSLQKL